MIVSVEVADHLAKQFHLENDALRSRHFLEAFVLQRFAEGELTSGQVGEALDLSFQQTEQFLYDHHTPANLGPEEHVRGLQNLERAFAR